MAALVKEVMLKILATDGDAQAKLDAITERAEALKEENPDLAVRIDTAAASAKLAVFRDELKDAAAGADEMSAALDEYNTAAAEAADTAAKLAAAQADDATTAGELSAAMDANSAATLRALDAQARLIGMEEKSAIAAQEAGDSAEGAGDKQLAAGKKGEEGAGLMKSAWGAAKLALLGVAGGLAFGIVKAAGFQAQMATLNTQAGVAKNQLGSLGSGVLALAGQVADSPDSLVQALYHVESSFQSVGITGPKALDLLKIAAEGAAVGHANLVDVTNALDATIVAGVPGIKSYSGAMGALNAIVGSGDMTMQDLATAMGTGVMAVAKSYGQSIYQVGAALATLGDNNIRGAKAATDLRMAWQAIQSPLKTATGYLNQIGLSQYELAHTMEHHGLSAALVQLTDHLKSSHVPISDWGQFVTEVFGKRAGVGIGVLLDQLKRLQSKFPDLEKGADKFGSAWKTQQQTVGQQWKDLESGIEALATKMGEKLLPATLKVVHGLTGFVNDLERGKAPAVAIAAVIGSLLAGVALDKLAGGLKTAASGFETLWSAGGKVLSWAGTMVGKLGAQAAATDELTASTEAETAAQGEADAAMDANPIGLIIIAIAALVIGIVEVVKHWKDFKQWGTDAWHAVTTAAVTAGHFLEHVFDDIRHDIDVLVDWVRDHWQLLAVILATVLLGPVGGLVVFIATHWQEIRSLTSRLVDDVTRFFDTLPGRILGALAGLGSMLFRAGADAIRGFIDGMGSMLGGVVSMAENLGSSAVHGVEHFLHIGSPSKVLYDRGVMSAKGFELGLGAGTAGVGAAATRMAAAVSGAVASGTRGGAMGVTQTGGGAPGGGVLRIEWVNSGGADQSFLTWLANHIRISGGDPQILRRKVVLA